MLKLKNLKRILIMSAMMLILTVGTSVYATAPTIGTINPTGGTGSPTTGTISPLNPTSGTIKPTSNTTPTPTPTGSSYNKNNLPKTGVDYNILFIILASVACAVFAYFKVRKYNIKY